MQHSSQKLKIRIAIDGNEANVPNRVGSNVYAYELLKAIEELTRTDDTVEVTVLLSGAPLADLPAARTGWSYQEVLPRPLWTQFGLPIHLFLHRQRYDVFFTPGHYAPRLSAVPYVSSVMDVAYLHYPEQFRPNDRVQLESWTKYSVAKAKKIITISEFSRSEIATHYKRHLDDIVVAYPAVTEAVNLPTLAAQKSILKKYKLQSPYIVYVGTLQPRKNLERLIDAYELLADKINSASKPPLFDHRARRWYRPKVKLVIAGKVGWLAEPIMARIAASPLKDDIVLTGFIDETTKQVLYAQAAASVLVGIYEGFGIPPLESMQLGTIPVVANSSSLPEVVGRAGIKVDPTNAAAIANGLWRALTLNLPQRHALQRAAAKQVQRFSWVESGRIVLATLKEVALAER